MRLLATVLLLISIIGLSFAQNSPDPLPSYGKTDLSEPFIEGKNLATGNLQLHPETPLMTGDTHLVRIHYQGIPEKGLYFRSNSNGDPVIYSHNEPYDAHFWFPCKDDPSDKARLVMTVDVPDQFIVLSNGELIDKTKSSPQNTKYLWQEDYPIATYLISIAADSYMITTNSFTWDGIDLLLNTIFTQPMYPGGPKLWKGLWKC